MMATQQILASPVFWLLLAILVATLLTLTLFGPEARLRRRLGWFNRTGRDIRLPADAVLKAPNRLRSGTEKALALLAAGRHSDAAVVFDRLAKPAQGPVKAELVNMAAVCYYIAERNESAVERYLQAAAIAEEAGAGPVAAAALSNITLLKLIRGEPDVAFKAQERALALDREADNKTGVALGLGRLGLVWQSRGDSTRALDHHLEALELDKEIGNKRSIAYDLGRIGLAYQVIGEHDKAKEYYQQGLVAARQARDRTAMAEIAGNAGLLELDRGNDMEALAGLLGALRLFGRLKDSSRTLNTLNGLRMVRERLGREKFEEGCQRFGVREQQLAKLSELIDKFGTAGKGGKKRDTSHISR